MNFGIFSMNEWLFPDSSAADGKKTASLKLLKEQTGAIQIFVDGLTVGAPVDVKAVGFDGVKVDAYREMEVCVNRNTNDYQCGALTGGQWRDIKRDRVRPAPYRAFDPLMPVDGIKVEKESEAYYISFCPQLDAESGVKEGKIVITFGDSSIEAPVTLTVGAKQLPESTLALTNWTWVNCMAYMHGLEYGTPEHEEMFKKYMQTLIDCKNFIFFVDLPNMYTCKKVDGKLVFDFSEAKRWAELALECGMTTLEWSHVLHRPSWEDGPFLIRNKSWEDYPLNCLSTEGRKYLTAYLYQFNQFLTENGWRDNSLVHVSDEPKERVADDFRILCGIYRKYLPGIKLIDAIEIYFVEDALDIYVPKDHYYQLNKNDFEAIRDENNELWFYTCNMPGGRFLNRHIDAPLLNTRLLHWGNYSHNLTGYLHWGYNAFEHHSGAFGQDISPFEVTSKNEGLPAGECNIVYPYEDKILLSLRYMEMKCGVEDYEILRALSLSDKKEADELCRRAFYAFDDYIKDVPEFDQITADLFDAYEKK